MGKLDEILEILDRAVAAAPVNIHDEGTAVGRCKDDIPSADLHGVRRIAGMLGELWRGRLSSSRSMTRWNLTSAPNRRPGTVPEVKRLGVVAELYARFGKDAVGGTFDL